MKATYERNYNNLDSAAYLQQFVVKYHAEIHAFPEYPHHTLPYTIFPFDKEKLMPSHKM